MLPFSVGEARRWIVQAIFVSLTLFACAGLVEGAIGASKEETNDMEPRDDSSGHVIPLKDIWALHMPGTRPMNRTMRDDPPAYVAPEGRLVDEIVRALKYDPQKHPVADEGFAVSGTGMQALREAHGVLVKGKVKKTSFRKDEKISLVFFSYQFGAYVHLLRAEQGGKVIRLSYRFVPHKTKEVTSHIALISVSNPGSGTIRVEVRLQTHTAAARNWRPWVDRIVCRSFVFSVSEE
jgi:hypothetical protein